MAHAESKGLEPGRPTSAAAGAAGSADQDEILAERAVAGDRNAFEALVVRYQDRVYSLLTRLCGSESEAEDLAQETFLKAYRALSGFRRGSKFYTWLFRIAVNTGYSRGRQLVRRQRLEVASLDAPVADPDGSGEGSAGWSATVTGPADEGPERAMEREWVRARVQQGLAQLEEDYRAVVLLRDMEGLDYAAIAETLDISRAAVKSRLHRARSELARILRDLRPDGRRKL